jgi:hypothetical protein
MKVSVPAAYSRVDSVPKEALSTLPLPESISQPEAEQRPVLPLLSAEWWQSFLCGNPDGLLENEDVLHALDLIANRLGKEIGQSEIGGNIRAGQLRKMLYAKFGTDLALRTMQALWLAATSDGEQFPMSTVPDTPETVAQFFEHEDAVPLHRWESDKDSAERRLRESFGGWCG